MTFSQAALLAAASVGAGIINAIAGGGTLLTFPALLSAGMPPVTANATNTLALWSGQLSGAWAYRSHIGDERARAISLAIPSVIGGVIGSVLVLAMPERVFAAVVPWLIVFACMLLALQGPIKRALASVPGADHPAALWVVQLLISIYGGYFGAAMGILMLAAMGILLPSSGQHANALKVLFSFLANGAAAVLFLALGAARLPEAVLMAVASTLGGYAGAHLAQRLPPAAMRGVAVAVGLYAAGRMLLV
ncbi:MAG TPA: sulfite exporter TauE/SafE family protein [Anaeromyxobacteraceae bacterium]|nr:sulfite exporter TauE/SafE family protein [Anaeromyxobacteraceae bacterium]